MKLHAVTESGASALAEQKYSGNSGNFPHPLVNGAAAGESEGFIRLGILRRSELQEAALRFWAKIGTPEAGPSGYVAVFHGKGFAWFLDLPDARSVIPGTFLVDIQSGAGRGKIRYAIGGSDVSGAERWVCEE